MMAINDEEGFLEEIQASPDDDAPRWIYADWLEERSDPRAEFVRVQCQLAQSKASGSPAPDLEARERELAAERKKACLEELGPFGVKDIRFSRGLVEKLHCVGTQVLDHPRLLFKHAPALRAMLLRHPSKSGAGVLQRILSSPQLRCLSVLDLSHNDLRIIGSEELADSARPVQLASLNLSHNQLSGRGIAELLADSFLDGITTLNLAHNELSRNDARQLATTPHLASLTSLALDGNPIQDEGLRLIAGSVTLAGLENLSLRDTDLTAPGMKPFANSATLTRLTTLDLSQNPLGQAGAAILASTSNVALLTSLNLSRCEIDTEGARALAASLYLKKLATLNLTGNQIENGAIAFATTTKLPALANLNLSANGLDFKTADVLAASSRLRELTLLDLSGNNLANRPSLRDAFGSDRIVL